MSQRAWILSSLAHLVVWLGVLFAAKRRDDAPQPVPPQRLVVRALEVVDEHGVVRIRLNAMSGGASVTLVGDAAGAFVDIRSRRDQSSALVSSQNGFVWLGAGSGQDGVLVTTDDRGPAFGTQPLTGGPSGK